MKYTLTPVQVAGLPSLVEVMELVSGQVHFVRTGIDSNFLQHINRCLRAASAAYPLWHS